MAHTMGFVFFFLVGNSAFQTTENLHVALNDPVCRQGEIGFEAFNASFPNDCAVYCVPLGPCLGEMKAGRFSSIGITSEGNCQSKGFTQEGLPGPIIKRIQDDLSAIEGSCSGIMVRRYSRPSQEDPTLTAEFPAVFAQSAHCGPDMISYEADGPENDPHDRGTCYRYCVPRGKCNEIFQSSEFPFALIGGLGDCRSSGYTQLSPKVDGMESEMASDIMHADGPCKGITFTKWQKPHIAMAEEPNIAAVEIENGNDKSALCKPGQVQFEALAYQEVGSCSIVCVPEGLCVDLAQAGQFKFIGITGRGTCQKYQQKVSAQTMNDNEIQEMLSNMHGPCSGMTVHSFWDPAMDPDLIRTK